jgi:hypothetical protein
MCGGPVVLDQKRYPKNTACGMLEGIVPLEHPIPEFRGLAAFISSLEVSTFIANIEAGCDSVVKLEGGEALRKVTR